MAASAANLTSGGSTSTPGTTASIAPGGSRVLLVEVAVTKTGAPAPAAGDVAVSGLGLTWQQVQDTGGAVLTQEYRVRRRLYWFVAETAGAPTPGALTITYSGAATFQEMAWSVEELSGVVLGANGQDAIGGIGNTSVGTGSTEISVTIIDTPVAGDISMGMAGIEQGGGAPGISSPATAVVLSNVEHTNVRHLIVGYDPDAAMAFTFGPWASSSNGAGAMGLRIIAAAGGGPVALDGTGPGAGSATGSMSSTRPVAAESATAGGAVGTLAADRALAGSAPATSSASGSLSVARPVSGTSAAADVASGTATADRPLSGSTAAAATGSGSLTVAGAGVVPFAATAAAASAATGALAILRTLVGTSPTVSSSTVQLSAARPLAGTAAAASSATGRLVDEVAPGVLNLVPSTVATSVVIEGRIPSVAQVPQTVPTAGGVA